MKHNILNTLTPFYFKIPFAAVLFIDTRHTGQLLSHLTILTITRTTVIICHQSLYLFWRSCSQTLIMHYSACSIEYYHKIYYTNQTNTVKISSCSYRIILHPSKTHWLIRSVLHARYGNLICQFSRVVSVYTLVSYQLVYTKVVAHIDYQCSRFM